MPTLQSQATEELQKLFEGKIIEPPMGITFLGDSEVSIRATRTIQGDVTPGTCRLYLSVMTVDTWKYPFKGITLVVREADTQRLLGIEVLEKSAKPFELWAQFRDIPNGSKVQIEVKRET